MSIPVVFGWGKNSKDVGYIGIHNCPHCKSFTHFTIKEIANNVRVYFIPVAKFNKKYYLVCGHCQNGWELDYERKDQFFSDSRNSLTPDRTIQLWNRIGAQLEVFINNSNTRELRDLMDDVISDFGDTQYVQDHISRYMNQFQDKE